MTRRCMALGCDRTHYGRGLCNVHHLRFKRTGRLTVRSAAERFWSFVDRRGNGCWEWLGGKTYEGYGVFSVDHRSFPAHRWGYRLVRGPIPDGFHLDHLCRNPSCVNPGHLEPVTPAENNRRSNSPSSLNLRKVACPQGHPYDGVNANGRRICSVCLRSGVR